MTSLPPEDPPVPDESEPSPLLPSAICVAILVIATIAALWPVLKCDFTTWDDGMTVSENPFLKPPSPAGVIRYWKRPAMGLYIPVTYTAWSAIAFLSPPPLIPGAPMQLDPTLFHGANLLTHVCAAIVVWRILTLLLRRTARDGNILIPATLGALIFAIHPVQVESVAWVSGLKDLLSGLFALVAIWQYIVFTEIPARSTERMLRYLIVLAAAGFAMLAKPSAMVLPLVIAIIDHFLLKRPAREIFRGVMGVALIVLPCAVGAALIQHPPRHVALWQRPMVVLDSLSFYTIKLLWPLKLAPDYGRRPTDVMGGNLIWFCWVIPAILGASLWILRKRAPGIVIGVLIFIAAVLPTLGFVNTLFQDKSTVADHYLYVSMLGIALLIATIVAKWRSGITTGVVAGILLACGILSFRQTWFWENTFALFTHTAEVSPRSWAARMALGVELTNQKKFDEATRSVQDAVAIYPSSVNHSMLGQVYLAAGKPADAIAPLQKALELEPGLEGARFALASAYLNSGSPRDAVRELQQLLREHPEDDRAKQLLQVAESRSRI